MIETTRRHWLGLAGAGLAAIAGAGRAAQAGAFALTGAADARTRDAMARLRAFAQAECAAMGLPGLTLAWVGPNGAQSIQTFGLADVERGRPVTPDHLFQIGSISKSFAALAAHRLAADRKLALETRAATLLPGWALPDAPITLQHLLDHVSGLPGNAPPFPDTPDGLLWVNAAPGARFVYSNTGYLLAGMAVDRAAGRRYPDAIAALVVDPLGLRATKPAIGTADRAAYAIGYMPLRSDLGGPPGAALAPGAWFDSDNPAGSVASTPADMARYLRALIALKRGRANPLLDPAAAARFFSAGGPAPDFGPGATYRNGLALIPVDGAPALHHTGGMLSFSSALTFDAAAETGCFASSNIGSTGYRPRRVTAYGVMLGRALASGAPLPDAPAIPDRLGVEQAGRFAGRFLSADGPPIVVAPADGGRLSITGESATALLFPVGETRLASAHPTLGRALLDYDADGGRFWWRDRLYGRDAAPRRPAPDAELLPMQGTYLGTDPWAASGTVIVRGDALVLEGVGTLARHGDGSWRLDDPDWLNERLWFRHRAGDRFETLSVSGDAIPRLRTRNALA